MVINRVSGRSFRDYYETNSYIKRTMQEASLVLRTMYQREDDDMKVAEYHIGNSTVEIHDDYIVKTEEERQRILERVGKIYSTYLFKNKVGGPGEQA